MENSILTITFVNQNYIELAKNWLLSVEKTGYEGEIKIYALDDRTERSLPKDVIERVPFEVTSLESLWSLRVEIFRSISLSGTSFIHSDVDAVWLKNPLLYIKGTETPYIFSQGTVHPGDVHEDLNFVFCCGFFFSSAVIQPKLTQDYMARWEESTRITQDDQTSINRIIANDISRSFMQSSQRIESEAGSYLVFENSLKLKHKDTNLPLVTLLPHSKFPRLLIERERPEWVVAHPLAPKNSKEKIEFLKANRLWIEN